MQPGRAGCAGGIMSTVFFNGALIRIPQSMGAV